MLHADLEQAPLRHSSSEPTPEKTYVGSRQAPGTMRLLALREHGRIVDFYWASASPAAAKLLHCDVHELLGKGLRETVSGGPLGHPALIDRYRRVLEHGNAQSFAQVHMIEDRQDVVVHRVVRQGDGVVVTLTNLSADRRKQAWRLEHGERQPSDERTSQ